jgi:hypothetical protein
MSTPWFPVDNPLTGWDLNIILLDIDPMIFHVISNSIQLHPMTVCLFNIAAMENDDV